MVIIIPYLHVQLIWSINDNGFKVELKSSKFSATNFYSKQTVPFRYKLKRVAVIILHKTKDDERDEGDKHKRKANRRVCIRIYCRYKEYCLHEICDYLFRPRCILCSHEIYLHKIRALGSLIAILYNNLRKKSIYVNNNRLLLAQ